jgi:hypothetical protein
MVYSSGTKMARSTQSIANRPTCGGNMKAGIVSSIGYNLSNHSALKRTIQTMPLTCVVDRTIQTQKYGYRATIG